MRIQKEQLWESYQVQSKVFEKKKSYEKLTLSYEKAVADISFKSAMI